MARSGDFGWVGSRIWARGKGLATSKKGESRREMTPDGRRRKFLLWKVAGGLGRPFGGLRKYLWKLKSKQTCEIRISGPPEYIRTPRSVGHLGLAAFWTPDQPPEVATLLDMDAESPHRHPSRRGVLSCHFVVGVSEALTWPGAIHAS